jgi:ABC-2 type transport system ATP-binding protein
VVPVLQFDNISKRYSSLLPRRERWALRDFSLEVNRGEIVGFLGPNGAGKTTALHIALGLARPTSGRGKLLGKPLGDVHARKRVGFLPESPAYYHRSARQTLLRAGELNGVREPELSRRTSQLLEAVAMTHDVERNVGKFSRGMLQRIGIAQALMNDPDLLILDEPTSALDPMSRVQVRQLLIDSRSKGKSVFLSSHQLSEIELICDRVFFLHAGQVVASGNTHELLRTSDVFEVVVAELTEIPNDAIDVRRDGVRTSFTLPRNRLRRGIERIWASGGTLVSVNPKTRTLEEIFVSVIRGKSDPTHGDSGK